MSHNSNSQQNTPHYSSAHDPNPLVGLFFMVGGAAIATTVIGTVFLFIFPPAVLISPLVGIPVGAVGGMYAYVFLNMICS